jgi:hypothetical protein
MNTARIACAVPLTVALVGGVAVTADAGSGEVRRSRHVVAGTHWWGKTPWDANTTARRVRGARDSARLCLGNTKSLGLLANYRIYAYDKHGRLLASKSEDGAHFGCRTLAAPRATTRFRFRLNVEDDGSGEKTWTMRSTR